MEELLPLIKERGGEASSDEQKLAVDKQMREALIPCLIELPGISVENETQTFRRGFLDLLQNTAFHHMQLSGASQDTEERKQPTDGVKGRLADAAALAFLAEKAYRVEGIDAHRHAISKSLHFLSKLVLVFGRNVLGEGDDAPGEEMWGWKLKGNDQALEAARAKIKATAVGDDVLEKVKNALPLGSDPGDIGQLAYPLLRDLLPPASS